MSSVRWERRIFFLSNSDERCLQSLGIDEATTTQVTDSFETSEE